MRDIFVQINFRSAEDVVSGSPIGRSMDFVVPQTTRIAARLPALRAAAQLAEAGHQVMNVFVDGVREEKSDA